MATRFWFPAATTADVTVLPKTSWTSTTGYQLKKMVAIKGSSSITTGTTISMSSGAQGTTALDRIYVSVPLAAQTILGTAKLSGQLMAREFATSDNVDCLITRIYLVSNDGGTYGDELTSPQAYGSINELINNATCRNVLMIDGTYVDVQTYGSTGGNVTVNDGDRLVIEIGADNALSVGTTPQFACKYGENATDLPVDDTQTTDGAGWFEISQTLTFQSATSAINGTAAAVFGQTGSSKGTGTLVGTSAAVFGQTGSSTGKGTLGGTSAAAFGQTGTANGAGTLVGTSAAVFGQTGSAPGTASCVGTSAAVFGQTGSSKGAGTLGGTSAAVFGQTGTAGGSGPCVGTSASVFGQTGTAAGSASCVGAAASVFGQTGSARGTGTLGGSSSALFGQTGTALGAGSLAGTVAATFGQSAVGGMAQLIITSATTSMTFGQVGSAGIKVPYAGTVSASFYALATGGLAYQALFAIHLASTVPVTTGMSGNVQAKTRLRQTVGKVTAVAATVRKSTRLRFTVAVEPQ